MSDSRKLHKLVAIALALWFLFPASAARGSSPTVVTLWVGNPVMAIGTKRQPIDTEGTKPVIVESRTLVPIRAVIEAFGGVVEWDDKTRRVMIVLGDNTLDLWIGRSTASLNGTTLPIDTANPRALSVFRMNSTAQSVSSMVSAALSAIRYCTRPVERSICAVSPSVPVKKTI